MNYKHLLQKYMHMVYTHKGAFFFDPGKPPGCLAPALDATPSDEEVQELCRLAMLPALEDDPKGNTRTTGKQDGKHLRFIVEDCLHGNAINVTIGWYTNKGDEAIVRLNRIIGKHEEANDVGMKMIAFGADILRMNQDMKKRNHPGNLT